MSSESFEFSFKALGGDNWLKFFAPGPGEANHIAGQVIAEVDRIETKFSRYLDQSVVSQINSAAGEKPVEVDQETVELLNYADACFQESEGLFDITSGVLRRVWDFRSGRLPKSDEIEEVLPLIGWDSVEWEVPSVRLPKSGMEIDFGGIGKEFAVDRCANVLFASGVRHGFVNLSGDLRVIGPKPDGSPWIIGIQHPRQAGALSGIKVRSGAVASSGDYERYMEIDGRRYCHILNPKTGWPIDDMRAVTVQTDSCLVAGSVATIAMLLGEKVGKRYLKQTGFRYFVVNGSGQVSAHPKKMIVKTSAPDAAGFGVGLRAG